MNAKWLNCSGEGIASGTIRGSSETGPVSGKMIGAQCNRKTLTQLMREAEELQTIERERAKQRMLAGKAIDPVPTLAQGTAGKTRDKVALCRVCLRLWGFTAPGKARNTSEKFSEVIKGETDTK